MVAKVFITPWIDLNDNEIRKCIQAGANSARIHTGKHTAQRINSLIDFYHQEKFKFYLDLRGNKASISHIDTGSDSTVLELREKVIIYASSNTKKNVPFDDLSQLTRNFSHYLGFNFLPQAVLKPVQGNFAFDDGRVLIQIQKLHLSAKADETFIECIVSQSGKVFLGDGVSSTDIFIHSDSKQPFSPQDIVILSSIPKQQKLKVKNVAVSFIESANQISKAQEVLTDLGFKDFNIVAKVETIKGINSLEEICQKLKQDYGINAEVQIGRGDLTLDCGRINPILEVSDLVDKAIAICKENKVFVSVLALVFESTRLKLKKNPHETILATKNEITNIKHLLDLQVDQIGLTNDMYISQPERMVQKLRQIVGNP